MSRKAQTFDTNPSLEELFTATCASAEFHGSKLPASLLQSQNRPYVVIWISTGDMSMEVVISRQSKKLISNQSTSCAPIEAVYILLVGGMMRFSIVLIAVAFCCSCDNTPTISAPIPNLIASAKAEEDAVQAVQRAEAQRKSAEKSQILRDPNSFIETSGAQIYDKGIINTYRQLTSITLLNKSHFALRNIQASVDWIDDKNSPIGSTSVTLAGSIPAGDTKQFATQDQTMTSTTIQGSGTKYRVKFTHVDIID